MTIEPFRPRRLAAMKSIERMGIDLKGCNAMKYI